MIAGITGHQNLPHKNLPSIIQLLEQKILEYQISRGITCLAKGADQLFSKILLQHQIPFISVLPCYYYNEVFSDNELLQMYHCYKLKAMKHIYLPNLIQSEKAFYDAGKLVVDLSQMLFAIWDGEKSRGLGGTADVVNYARSQKKIVLHIHSNLLNTSCL